MGKPLSDEIRWTRYYRKLVIDQERGCWLWQGNKNGHGYGIVRINYKYVRAHRAFYERLVGPIPEGLGLLHSCDVRACVNPGHLRPGTQLDNVADAISRGRAAGASATNAAKTHCIRGHELVTVGDRRRCKTCKNDQQRKRHAERMKDPEYREARRAAKQRLRASRRPST